MNNERSIGCGRAEQTCTPAPDSVTSFAQGGIVHMSGAADNDQVPFTISRCAFDDVARVLVLPEGKKP